MVASGSWDLAAGASVAHEVPAVKHVRAPSWALVMARRKSILGPETWTTFDGLQRLEACKALGEQTIIAIVVQARSSL